MKHKIMDEDWISHADESTISWHYEVCEYCVATETSIVQVTKMADIGREG